MIKLSIIIPSFLGHTNEILRFLNSNKKYNKDNHYTDIYIIVSSFEVEYFTKITKKFNNVFILNFKLLMKQYFNLDMDENNFLKSQGKVSFQSYKKLCGMLESKQYIKIFLTDSETYFIRECNLLQELMNTKTILYSYKINNICQATALNIAKNILNINYKLPWIGLVFSYQWIFNYNDILDFFNNYKENLIENTILKNNKCFFIEITLYSYLFIKKKNYNFINLTDKLNYTDCEHFYFNLKYNKTDKKVINYIMYNSNIFCYSIQQDNVNLKNNMKLIDNYKNIKILTSTPHNFNKILYYDIFIQLIIIICGIILTKYKIILTKYKIIT